MANKDPDARPSAADTDAAITNRDHPTAPGVRAPVPGAGVVSPTTDAGPVLTDPDRPYPGKDAPDARLQAPGAERPGTTDSGSGANVARGGVRNTSGLGEIETGTDATTAYSPATGGTGAPTPGSSGTRETSDPNYPARKDKGE
jgi:hypothetical protein